MKKSYIITLILSFIISSLVLGDEIRIADKWIAEQVMLQYSPKASSFKAKQADFSFCGEELDHFAERKEKIYDHIFHGKDAHDILNLYRDNEIKGRIVWRSPFPFFSKRFELKFSEEITVLDVVTYYLLKMRRSQERGMNIILSVNKNSLEEASYWDSKRDEMGKYPIFGIPVVIKANIGTSDSQPTSAGAIALENSFCKRDAFIVSRIKQSGGIILAKTNLSEWANFMSENSSNGFSSLGGQTVNPYGRFDAGGSSSGSAAAVAMGLSPLALGTETSGSIVYPASQNSVIGLKPSLGLVSRDCIIPIAEAQDTAGPITSSVRDAALMLSVIAGIDKADPATSSCSEIMTDYRLSEPSGKPLKGMRLGLVGNDLMRQYYYRTGEGIIQLRIAGELKKAGAEVLFIEMDESIYDKLDVLSVFKYQFRSGINSYLENLARGQKCRSLAQIIEFNLENPEERMPFGQELLTASENNNSTADEIESLAESNRKAAGDVIDNLLADNGLTLLFSLSNHMSYIYAAAGYPAICVPAGYKGDGEPIGVTFVGSKGDERLLLQVAYGYEKATGHRVNPGLFSQ